jgi:(p)ppGpp synthase/HD superfamily hydrolase
MNIFEIANLNDVIIKELNVKKTLDFIKTAHSDQLYGSSPYWTHPRAVALTGRKIFGKKFNSDAVKTAFLHDVVEDTAISLADLRKLDFSNQVIEAVGLLTKDKSLNYEQNIKKIIASGNPLAMMVKYADNYENFTGDKSSWDPAKADASQKKYLASLNMLGDVLGVKYHAG